MAPPINIPMSAIGVRGPWEDEDFIPEVHYCDNNCGSKVEEEFQWCDACLVANAEACGDWDDEAIEARERISKAA